ncbi:hypothetical protein Q1695_012333 [Nippostrongylus brasiliensis]|nr:hypothetical protein Q1695_012333 [Nippostrongylus brasiliensis]
MSQRGESDDGANRTNLEECEVCNKMMTRLNIYRHLRNIHKYSDEDVERVKRTLRMESFTTEASEDGANGDEQDYTVHSSTFESEESLRHG